VSLKKLKKTIVLMGKLLDILPLLGNKSRRYYVANKLPSLTIPGNSLTKEPGNSPMEQPPMFVELSDVVDYYSEKITSNESVSVITKSLAANISVVELTNVMIKAGVMQGIHSIDSAMLAFPVIAEMIKTIGDINDVGYVESDEDFKKATELDESVYMELIEKSQAKIEEAMDKAVIPRKGLMSKGVIE
tara:strand:- start:610 stop:1176 length:567 start_codon:yes stop_codon:yes gene_type:complete